MAEKGKDDKMEGYRAEEMTPEKASEALETAEEGLEPDPSVSVPGEEAAAASSGDHKERMKHLFDKSRTRRDQMIQTDEQEHPDAERMKRAMEAEARGEDAEAAYLDTNRDIAESDVPDAFKYDVADEREALRKDAAKHESENVNKGDDSAPDSLSQPAADAKVPVKIDGKEYLVPQQDIDDAGGLDLYQKARYTNMRLERIATLDKALETPPPQVTGNEDQQDADLPTGGYDEADITRLRDRVVDALAEGKEMSDVDEILRDGISSAPAPTPETPQPAPEPRVHPVVQQAREELEAQRMADMKDANEMMREDYPDILNDADALTLARQRFNYMAAQEDNAGRTQKELSRESAEWVRSFGRKFNSEGTSPDPMETERERRIVRKRKLPQPSRADAPVPGQEEQPDATTKERRRSYIERLRERSGHA
jgi:hypothetical protein